MTTVEAEREIKSKAAVGRLQCEQGPARDEGAALPSSQLCLHLTSVDPVCVRGALGLGDADFIYRS